MSALPRTQRLALLRWNEAIVRARLDYYAYPNRACRVTDCENLHGNLGSLCKEHAAMARRLRRRT